MIFKDKVKKIFHCHRFGASFSNNDFYSINNNIYAKPEKSLNETKKHYLHYHCPAFQEWNKNTWTVRLTEDLIFEYKNEDNKIISNLDNQNKNFFHCINNKDKYPEIQFFDSHLFWTNEKDVWIELLHHPQISNYGINLIPGAFPLSVWIREIQFAFRLVVLNKKIFIPTGTPLYYVRFYCKNNKNNVFEMEEKIPTKEIYEQINKNIEYRYNNPNKSWDFILKKINKKKLTRCPFLNII